MVKVVDFKKVVLVTTILFVVGVGFLVERLVFSNQVATAVLFSYSKEIISFNIPIFSDHFANKIIKIENIGVLIRCLLEQTFKKLKVYLYRKTMLL
jgi:stage II sporulation protein P